MALKRRVLQAQFEAAKQDPELIEAQRRFVRDRPAVADYAAFRAAIERLGSDWHTWPEPAHQGRLAPEDYDPDTAGYHTFAQWRAQSQVDNLATRVRGLEMRLYLDLPVGVHPGGFDAWRQQDIFAHGISVGAPPDRLATDGQDWGFQPLKPEAQRRSGYDYMRAYLRHHLSAAGMLRIDHAIGLHRLFWIPEGGTAHDGVFVRQHFDEIYAVLSLESHRHQSVIVGEDLGLVPPEVEEGLHTHGISGMYVQMFEMTADAYSPLQPPAEDRVASFSTHDLPPFAAYWQDEDLVLRLKLGLLTEETMREQASERERQRIALLTYLRDHGRINDTPTIEAIYRASMALLAESDASRLVVNLEDTWSEVRLQNLPGTVSEQYPSWTQRAAYSLEEIQDLPQVQAALQTIRDIRG